MFNAALNRISLDRLAIGLSGLCLVHCVASVIVVTILASAGGVLFNPIFHEIGLVLAMLLGSIALGRGIMLHGRTMPALIGSLGLGMMASAMTMPHGGSGEIIFSIIGVMILALGHDLNRRAAN